jgi:Siphovirus ReqiPepy6 Gp37-like protein
MELLTLDNNYQPSELIERYASLVWTERYSNAGDFQLVTTDVERMINLLPLESMVTLRESTVPMLVEVHKIEKSFTGAPVLTVTGRSFETVLERRATLLIGSAPDGTPGTFRPWNEAANSPSCAAYYAIRRMIGDLVDRRSEAGVTPPDGYQLSPQSPWITSEDALPMVDLPIPADFVNVEFSDATPEQLYEIKFGNLYTVVMELLNSNHHGLKSIRPAVNDVAKIGIEIYNGADLTNVVVFDAKFDQFEDSTYLLSNAGSANWGYVVSKTAFVEVPKTLAPVPSGLDRRVMLVDITGEEGVDTSEARRTRGLIELYKYNATALFDGQIGDQVASGYNNDYFLGDIIRLDGEYGLSQNVRVAEFIRSEDSTGSKAYPTFEAIVE